MVSTPFDSDLAIRHSAYVIPKGNELILEADGKPAPEPNRFVHAQLRAMVLDPAFSCIAGRSALKNGDCRFGFYPEMATEAATLGLGRDLRRFVVEQTQMGDVLSTFFASFAGPCVSTEDAFEALLWKQLQMLHDAEADFEPWDPAASSNPDDASFYISLAGRAFFIVGLHAASSRFTRRFAWPTLVFNAKFLFERLHETNQFSKFQEIIRKREMRLQGDLNPNVHDIERSVVRQYSGRRAEDDWRCPFHQRNEEASRREAWIAQCKALKGRRVLLVGGADVSKRITFESARAHGVEVVLVESKWPFPKEIGIGDETVDVIRVPTLHADHTEEAEQAHCAKILAELERKGTRIDGVTTFWDEATAIAAMVAERLGLPGNPVAAQKRTRSKLETYRALAANAPDLVVPFVELASPDEVRSARAAAVPYPAIVKWCHGASAVGTFAVGSPEDAERAVSHLLSLLRDPEASSLKYPGRCFRVGRPDASIVLMECISGSEHDVDLLLHEGELVDAFVTDNAVVPPSCGEACALMPSALPPASQDALIDAAYRACKALGLTNGAVNAELMLSSAGPKVIEINGRMGGVYIATWASEIWSFDLPAAVLMTTCGLHPVGRPRRAPRCHIAGVSCFPGDGASLDAPLGADARKVLYDLAPDGPADAPWASVGFRSASAEEAVARASEELPALFAANPARASVLEKALRALLRR